jgi:hypothetical protein
MPQGQRPAQPASYPQEGGYLGGYPDGRAAVPGYDSQAGYHYPQNGQDAPSYPSAQTGYGQPQQSSYAQPQQSGTPAGFRSVPYGTSGADSQQAPAGFEPWPVGGPAQDPLGYDFNGYMPANAPHPGGAPLPSEAQDHLQPDWMSGGQLGYSEGGALRDPYAGGQMGYDALHGGALEQTYAEDDGADFDVEEPRGGSWALRIAGAIVVAIGLGYGLAQGYKLVAGGRPDGAAPVVRGESAPSRTLPADPGGKQFDHADAKIMDRLGDGSPSETAASDTGGDANSGARKVQTLVVGRDGSITPASQPDEPVTTGAVAVPGLTVIDGFGGGAPRSPQVAPAARSSAPEQPVAQEPAGEEPPASESERVEVAPAEETPEEPAVSALEEPDPPVRTAAATPPPSRSTSSGYVVVLASVPASSSSRLSALRKFADMQEKFGTVLRNKTPDVQEANLGARGTYHRLLVGPPSSRAQANTLCGDLKAAGYKDCWVMAY